MVYDLLFKGKDLKRSALRVYASLFEALASFNYSAGVMNMPKAPDDFTPVMRFTIASDVHINDDGKDAERARLARMIQKSYEIAAAHPHYKALDAVCFAGDISDAGTRTSFEIFKRICEENIKEGTLFLPVLGNHDFKTAKENTRKLFTEVFGLNADFNYAVNGVHIIGTAKCGDDDKRDKTTMRWLRAQLKSAKAENPRLPIFVIQHEHIFNTVYGSIHWADFALKSVFSKFPQVIDFSGHSHYPINDPRSIWQGKFTALGTGSLSYFELEVDAESGKFPENHREAAQMYVVETAADGATRIRCYDLISDAFFGEDYYLPKPSDRSTFAYNRTNRRAKSKDPVFPAGTVIETKMLENGDTALVFGSAEDELALHNYRVTVKDEKGRYVFEDTFITDYFLAHPSSVTTIPVGKLVSGKRYSATIVAENAFGLRSLPLAGAFTAK